MIVAMALATLMLSIAFTVANSRARMHAMSLWAAALYFQFGATVLYALRDVIPLWVSAVVAFTALNAGLMLEYAALREFSSLRIHWRLLAAIVIVASAAHAVLFLTEPQDERTRIILVSFAMAAWLAASAILLFNTAKGRERYSHAMAGTFFAIWALFCSVRGSYALVANDPTMTLLGVNGVQTVWLTVQFMALLGTSLGFVMMTKERSDEEIIRVAATDSLTGLLNRRTFVEAAHTELARALRQRLPSCVLMLDLDHFKRVNDTYGHHAGDMVLQDFGSVLRNSVRPFDLVARYGGEEFCALLIDVGAAQAIAIAERIRSGAAAHAVEIGGGRTVRYTVSIGVTSVPPDTRVLDEIVDRADDALYLAKNEGRDRVVSLPSASAETSAAPQA